MARRPIAAYHGRAFLEESESTQTCAVWSCVKFPAPTGAESHVVPVQKRGEDDVVGARAHYEKRRSGVRVFF